MLSHAQVVCLRPVSGTPDTRATVDAYAPRQLDELQHRDVRRRGSVPSGMSLCHRLEIAAQSVTGRRRTHLPNSAVVGWDNAEHARGRAVPRRRERLTRVHRLSAYPDRTTHEYNASMTDDDGYWAALPNTLTPTQLAKILSVGKPAILRRLRAGTIPGYQIRASWIIFKPEIRAWLASTSNRPPAEPPKPVDVLDDYDDEMTYQDLMALFGKTKQTVYIWLHEGEIPAFHVGSRWVIHKAQVRERLREVSNQNVRSGDVDDTPNASR